MSDSDERMSHSWAAPGVAPVDTAIPIYAAPANRAAPARWTPPPKRGLLPIRPVGFGQVLSAPFRLQRRTPLTTLGPALLVSGLSTTAAALVQWGLTVGPRAALDDSYYVDYVAAQVRLEMLGILGGFVPLAFALGAVALLGGVLAVGMSRALLAERTSLRGLGWRLRHRLGRLALWSVAVTLAAAVILVLGSLLPIAAASAAGFSGAGVGVVLLEAIPLVLVVGLLAARLGATSPAIALEGLGIRAAMHRSWTLTRGHGWRLLGEQLLIWVVVAVAAGVLSGPLGFVLANGSSLIFPNGATQAQSEGYAVVWIVVATLAATIVGAFGLVLQSGAAALLYLDLRMRVEGLDHTLARYVDDRQRGLVVVDPFPAGAAR